MECLIVHNSDSSLILNDGCCVYQLYGCILFKYFIFNERTNCIHRELTKSEFQKYFKVNNKITISNHFNIGSNTIKRLLRFDLQNYNYKCIVFGSNKFRSGSNVLLLIANHNLNLIHSDINNVDVFNKKLVDVMGNVKSDFDQVINIISCAFDDMSL